MRNIKVQTILAVYNVFGDKDKCIVVTHKGKNYYWFGNSIVNITRDSVKKIKLGTNSDIDCFTFSNIPEFIENAFVEYIETRGKEAIK